MKKNILTALAVFAFSFANAQESKGYIGVSIGAAFPGGDLTKYDNASTGINIGLINAGFRFNETFGLTLNWGASAFSYDVYGNSTFAMGYFALGPMFSFPVNNKLRIDFVEFTSSVATLVSSGKVAMAYRKRYESCDFVFTLYLMKRLRATES